MRLENRPDDFIKAIINADNLGMSISCTDAIYDVYKIGIISDTTIIANGNAFDKAVDYIRQDIDFGYNVGVHINFTEGKPLTDSIKRCSNLVRNGFLRDIS